jgi:hypothetical protein
VAAGAVRRARFTFAIDRPMELDLYKNFSFSRHFTGA